MYTQTNGLGQGFFDTIAKGIDAVTRTAQTAAQNPLKAAISSITVYSAYSPPVSYTADQIVAAYRAPAGPPGIMDRLKPTLVIESPLVGRKVFAPYGAANPTEYKANQRKVLFTVLGSAALLVAGSAFIGYRLGKRKARRAA